MTSKKWINGWIVATILIVLLYNVDVKSRFITLKDETKVVFSERSVNNQTFQLHSESKTVDSDLKMQKTVYSDWKMKNTVDWKMKELQRLGDLVQRRLTYLQNPKNCDTERKLLCKLANKDLTYITDIEVVQVPREASMKKSPIYIPPAIPQDLAADLTRVHQSPAVWWIGQLLVYLTRKNQTLKKFVEHKIQSLQFRHPIVGIHIRRTDKITEANYHELQEYMDNVEKWFEKYEKSHRAVQRKVFLASDDQNVLIQARKRYRSYTFITNINGSLMAESQKTRFSETAFRELIFEIEMLSRCDFVVCTFSSNVCRLVYEMMHVHFWDAPSRINSLDIDYYFHHDKWNEKGLPVKMPTYPEV